MSKVQDVKVEAGGTTRLECEAKGSPKPSVLWLIESLGPGLLHPGQSQGRMSVSARGSLVLQSAAKDDQGYVTCSAVSVAGSVSHRALVQVSTLIRRVLSSLQYLKAGYLELAGYDYTLLFYLVIYLKFQILFPFRK